MPDAESPQTEEGKDKKYKPLRIRDTNKQKKREIKRQKLQRAAEKWSTPVKEASIVRP